MAKEELRVGGDASVQKNVTLGGNTFFGSDAQAVNSEDLSNGRSAHALSTRGNAKIDDELVFWSS